MDATGWWTTTEATSSNMPTAMWWIAGLMHPTTIATTTKAFVTYSKNKNIQLKKNSKRNSLTWKIEKEAYHGSVDHHRANRYAFASLVALDPVKIYHVVDIHGNLDGVWKNTNEKYITNLATLISNPHVSLTYRANHHVRVGRLVDPNGNYRHHHHRSCVHHGICHAFYDRIHHQILPFSVNNFSKIFSVYIKRCLQSHITHWIFSAN